MNYQEAMAYIGNIHKYGSKLGLENIRYLLKLMGDPQKQLKFIHIAGTNGKGSTAAYIREVLVAEGYSVGLYTSPYLEVFNERIQWNHQLISDDEIACIISEMDGYICQMLEAGQNHPTEFEVITAMAFLYFLRKKVDFVILEVGLGGRFDATNVIEESLISIITSISFDHMKILGDTLTQIAFEKSGIIKPEGCVISYPQLEEAAIEIEKNAKLKQASYESFDKADIEIIEMTEKKSVFKMKDMELPLEITMLGEHQIYNAALAIKALVKLEGLGHVKLNKGQMLEAIKKTHWNGRLEVLSEKPLLLIDGAHNTDGAKVLTDSLKTTFADYRKVLCLGMLEDKDVDGVLKILLPAVDRVIITEPNSERALSIEEMTRKVEQYHLNYSIYKNREEAFEAVLKCINSENQLGIVAGSLYLIGEARTWFTNEFSKNNF